MDLEKSTVGMYRSLILQLLEKHLALLDVLETEGLPRLNSADPPWNVESLKTLFAQVIDNLKGVGKPPILVFVDALDECDEAQIRDMIYFFEDMGNVSQKNGIPLQICFASRPYPHISISHSLHLVLNGQDGHNEDIERYISSMLKIDHREAASQIHHQLMRKASGVFMWVVLVVDILNKEYDEGRSRRRLLEKLKDIPNDLHGLLRDILMRDDRNKAEMLLCIQWILFARQPLTPEQLYFAVVSGTEPEYISKWDRSETQIDTIRKFILNSSKGLAEITESNIPTVQFIHESVRDFLLKNNCLRDVWPDLSTDFQAASHDRLKTCCIAYIETTATALELENPLPKASSDEARSLRQSTCESFPLLEYAIQNVLRHADTAEHSGTSQVEFTRKFPTATWIEVNNLLEKYDVRRYTSNAPLLYILAEKNMSHLVNIHPSKLACFQENNERYGSPMFAALTTGSHETVLTFLDSHSESEPYPLHLHDIYAQSIGAGQKRQHIVPDFFSKKPFPKEIGTFDYLETWKIEALILCYILAVEDINAGIVRWDLLDNKMTLLEWAATKGHVIVVRLLLSLGADVVPETCRTEKTYHGTSPLARVVEGRRTALVQTLLDHGADIEFSGSSRDLSPLATTVLLGYDDIIRLLLDRGANIESKNENQQSVLFLAAKEGMRSVVELLLDNNAKIESRDAEGRTPLAVAVYKGRGSAVQLLLDKGADIESKDRRGRTPLLIAATDAWESAIRVLLNKGANIHSKDIEGQTALSLVKKRSTLYGDCEGVISLLQSCEANNPG